MSGFNRCLFSFFLNAIYEINLVIACWAASRPGPIQSPIKPLHLYQIFAVFLSFLLHRSSSMEFLDEESRPRFQFRPAPSSSSSSSQSATSTESHPINKLLICATTLTALLILTLTYLFASNLEPLTSILIWIAVSILIGPIAPNNVTFGDIRVGNGRIVEEPPQIPDPVENEVRKSRNRGAKDWRHVEEQKANRSDDVAVKEVKDEEEEEIRDVEKKRSEIEEREWTEEDFEMLKKQMAKNPVGKVRRWEVIAEAFNGRHKVENVVKMAKSMAERKVGNGGDSSYAQFLKHRKPLDGRVVESESKLDGEVVVAADWSTGEDKALLKALKAFPKDVAMRWEKISAAVPGRSKNACVKRVAELTRDFRSSKAS